MNMLKENQRPVWEGIFKFPSQEGGAIRLLGSKCSSCGKVFFPKRMICPHCYTDDTMTDHELSTKGKIYSYTVVHRPTPLINEVPYAYGFVDLSEDNFRIGCLFTEYKNLEIGGEGELLIEKVYTDKSGKEVMGYKFKPLKK